MVQVGLALAKWTLHHEASLEVVRLVKLPDRLLDPAVVLVGRQAAPIARGSSVIAPVAVRIGQQLRKYVRSLERDSTGVAFLEAQDSGMVSGVPAVVPLTLKRLDGAVLRERPQSILHSASEARIGRRNTGGVGRGRSHVADQNRGALLNVSECRQVGGVGLVHVEKLCLQVRAGHRVIRHLDKHAACQLPLD